MPEKTVVVGFLGSQLDSGQSAGRWEKWRPTISLVQHDDTLIDRLELLHSTKHTALAQQLVRDIANASPDTQVNLVPMDVSDPWDFGEMYAAEVALGSLLSPEVEALLDLFDRLQLEAVVRICQRSAQALPGVPVCRPLITLTPVPLRRPHQSMRLPHNTPTLPSYGVITLTG